MIILNFIEQQSLKKDTEHRTKTVTIPEWESNNLSIICLLFIQFNKCLFKNNEHRGTFS